MGCAWPRLPDFWVASLWRCSARVVALHLYPLTFAPGLWLNHEDEGGLWLLTRDIFSVRTGLTLGTHDEWLATMARFGSTLLVHC